MGIFLPEPHFAMHILLQLFSSEEPATLSIGDGDEDTNKSIVANTILQHVLPRNDDYDFKTKLIGHVILQNLGVRSKSKWKIWHFGGMCYIIFGWRVGRCYFAIE